MDEELPFSPFPDCNTPEIDLETAETPNRIDLEELPLETAIQFYGHHSDSKYIAKVIQNETGRKVIKIWFAHGSNCAIGPIESVISAEELWNFDGRAERGVMQNGRYYILPTFVYHGRDFTELSLSFGNGRSEPYTRLYVQRPK